MAANGITVELSSVLHRLETAEGNNGSEASIGMRKATIGLETRASQQTLWNMNGFNTDSSDDHYTSKAHCN